jgi:hypothetical protein
MTAERNIVPGPFVAGDYSVAVAVDAAVSDAFALPRIEDDKIIPLPMSTPEPLVFTIFAHFAALKFLEFLLFKLSFSPFFVIPCQNSGYGEYKHNNENSNQVFIKKHVLLLPS